MSSIPYTERKEDGTVIQNPSSALLCIDSEDQLQADLKATPSNTLSGATAVTPYKSLIYRGQALAAGKISRIALTEVNFNWAVPTITPYNNTFIIDAVTFGNISHLLTATVPEGWYNFTDLAAVLQTQLTAAAVAEFGAGYSVTVSVDTITFFFTITILTPGGNPPWANPYIVETELSQMLGFSGQTYIKNYTDFFSAVRGNFPRLTYTPYIDIVSQRLTKNQHVYDNSSSINTPVRSLVTRIYLNPEGIVSRVDEDLVIGASPFTINRQYSYPKQISWEPTENIDSIDLLVLDWKGRQLYSTPVSSFTYPEGLFTKTGMIVGNAAPYQFSLLLSEN